MGEPQAIIDPLTRAAVFLVATIDEGGEPIVRDLLADVAGLERSVGFRLPGTGLTCVTAIGSAAWDRLFSGPKPQELHVFPEFAGERHQAPSTPGDLLFHIKAESLDACFELGTTIADRLGAAATIVDETMGFRYFEQRDLLGFVDGTENPTGRGAYSAALVGAEDPEFDGGSYVIVQKYLHDMATWKLLTVEEQEMVIGRTKLDDYELPDTVKPVDSHVARTTVIDDNGDERQILRANMPFGSIKSGEFGTYFIGYAATPAVTETMLENMFVGSGDVTHDRILDFSTAVTGTLFFAPAVDFFDALPPPPISATSAVPHIPMTNGSLDIGSLKRSVTSS
ncbi:Dyp-type peroxidase [Antrihabitans sp. YC2-6]|uniref:Dyp-type peroxidase n=1 Tax=Antrihabitans sp. YC2-6 TaxID=2799498 RepID=UPI0018F2E5B7|nr:Dyp-type peroxidase [Antrihabitans sp. YC2-6]MBJ8345423.1 Dyp-type peroxidase [Antrihabitans sp. YC2-6]